MDTLAGGYMQGCPLSPNDRMLASVSDDKDRDSGTTSLRGSSVHPDKLDFLDLDQWNESQRDEDEDPPSCLRCSIEWKVTLNGKLIPKDTEQDVALASRVYWKSFLRAKLQSPGRIFSDDTSIVASATELGTRLGRAVQCYPKSV
ncbi:hypothetical protein BS50DRAFT_580208 [Corynespora cassiicola Philippines]|uniref:Uncharacterized protein n=1 Tax=Corynespora cassiicola Philippines TaxID=1448308 RepID=A0A2T2N137_CORCC|nr:hypothetical protein BS50DRAFT_580208 [Corynespora cassiicola Philippines]